ALLWPAVLAGRDPPERRCGAPAPARVRARREPRADRDVHRPDPGRGAGEVRRRGADRSLLEVLGRDADLLPGAPGRSLDRRRGRRLRSLGRPRPLGRIAEGRPGSAGVPPSHHGGAGAVAAPDKVKSLMDYGEYKHLTFERKPHGVVLITIDRPDVLNA